MSVGLKVDFLWYSIGTGSFVHSFFSTICYNLENENWGSKFPYIMNNLYEGELNYNDVSKAKEELLIIKNELKKFPPSKVIWDIEDLTQQPPWGNDISSDITDLSNYFVTCYGEDLFDVLFQALHDAAEEKQNVILESL